jgi:hypothetical protein
MAMNADLVGLLAAKLVLRRGQLGDVESAAIAIREAIVEATDEEARVCGPSAAVAVPTDPPSTRRTASGTTPPKAAAGLAKGSRAAGAQRYEARRPSTKTTAGAESGHTDRVERAFDDGKPHSMKDLAEELGLTRRQMKRVIHRLRHIKKTIRHVGAKRSGTYVRVSSAKSKS